MALSAPHCHRRCSPYLLVLFIAELFSSAALLRHWLSAQASERVPRAPCLTPVPPHPPTNPLLLSSVCVCAPGQQKAQHGELTVLRSVHLPTYQRTPGLDSTPHHHHHHHHLLVNARHLSSHSLCLSGDIYRAPAAGAELPEKISVCAEQRVFHLSCSAQVSILNGGTGSDR